MPKNVNNNENSESGISVQSDKKIPPAPPARNPATALSKETERSALVGEFNTRRIGTKITVQLVKGKCDVI